MGKSKLVKQSWGTGRFSGEIELSDNAKNLLINSINDIPNKVQEQKENIILSIFNQLLPEFKINLESGKRVTRILFENDPEREDYYFDYNTQNQIFLLSIKLCFSNDLRFEPKFEVIVPEGVFLNKFANDNQNQS
jgi:hypothetical protein